MQGVEYQQYVVPALIMGFFGWRFLKFRLARGKVRELIQGGALVVDVRSAGEFASGNREGSINIPLGELEKGIGRLDPAKPVIVCCASGARSGIAATILKRRGFRQVLNAGPWTNTVG